MSEIDELEGREGLPLLIDAVEDSLNYARGHLMEYDDYDAAIGSLEEAALLLDQVIYKNQRAALKASGKAE